MDKPPPLPSPQKSVPQPLPPPQHTQAKGQPPPPPQYAHYAQNLHYPPNTAYPYANPYYYNPYYPQPPPPTNGQPPPPPQYATYPYSYPYPQAQPLPPPTWNRNPNNPPPPPPKPLISPNHQTNTNHKDNSEKKPWVWDSNTKSKSVNPPSLEMYIQKCWKRFKLLPLHICTDTNKAKLQKQLKGRVSQTKANKTLFTIDWHNEAYPPLLRHLIEISTHSNHSSLVSPKKRKAQWNGTHNHSRKGKVAKTSIAHRDIQSFLNDHSHSNKSDSDMSCSDDENGKNVKFQIHRNNKARNQLKFKNPFTMDSSSDSSDREMIVLSKGRGFTTQKIRKKSKKKKRFSWTNNDGIDALNSKKNSEDKKEINRILERKKRFEAKHSNNNRIVKTVRNNTNHKKKLSHSSNLSMSKDMRQLMDWHNKRVIGTCTKVEKDYFRLTSEPNPNEVRTLETMEKAFSLLMIRWKTKNKRDYLYVCGQFKSLRQDLRVQHIRNAFSIRVYEENAKICLEVGDLSEYNQCQGQLKELYQEMEEFGDNYIEFLSYRLLYEAVTKNFNTVSNIIKIEQKYIGHNKEIQCKILPIITAIQRTDYYAFFKIYAKLRYHGRCILDQIIYKIRYQTLNRIAVSYCPSTYPIHKLVSTIGFANERECIQYLRNTGCVLERANNKLVLNCKKSRGKLKEFVPKNNDDELGVTHGSVYHSKNNDETSIAKFLRKT